jgi:dienelactone hydrolase
MSQSAGLGAAVARLTRTSYQRADAEDSWQRIFAFFGEHLS